MFLTFHMHLGKASTAQAHCPYYAPICLQYIGKGKTHSSVFEDLMAMHWSSLLQKHVAPSKAEDKEEKQSVKKQRIIEDLELKGNHKYHRSPASD